MFQISFILYPMYRDELTYKRIGEPLVDLLLIDVNMPLMDGFQLAQKLLQKDLNVRVCFMTAGEINMDAAREAHPLKSIGCFIKKPITTEQLIKRIRAELE